MEIFNCLNEAFYIDSDGPFYAVSNNTNGCVALAFETRKYGDEYIENNINFFISRGNPKPVLKPVLNSFDFMLLCAKHGLAGIELLSENDQKSFNFCVRLEEFSSELPTALSYNYEDNISYIKTRVHEYKEPTYSSIKDWQRYDILDKIAAGFSIKNLLRIMGEDTFFEIRTNSNMILSLFNVPCRHNYNSLHGSIPFFITIRDAISFLNDKKYNTNLMHFGGLKTDFNDLVMDLSKFSVDYKIIKIDDLKKRLNEIDIPFIGFVINPNGTRDSMVYGDLNSDDESFPVAKGISGTWKILSANKFEKNEDRNSWIGSDSFYWNQVNSYKLSKLDRSFSHESLTTSYSNLTELEIDELIELKFVDEEFQFEEMDIDIFPETIEDKINSYCIISWDPVTGEREDDPIYFKSILDLIVWLWQYECSRDFPIRLNGAHQCNGLFGVAGALDKDYEKTIHFKIRKQLINFYKKSSLYGYKTEDTFNLCGLINCFYKTIHIDLIGYTKDLLFQLDGNEKKEVLEILEIPEDIEMTFNYKFLIDVKGAKIAEGILGDHVMEKMSDRSKHFVSSSLSQLEMMGISPQLDYSLVSIGFVKALEYELGLIFKNFSMNNDLSKVDYDETDLAEKIIVDMSKNKIDNKLTLGNMRYLIKPKLREKNELRLKLGEFLDNLPCGNYILNKKFYEDGISKITNKFRNGGAHDSSISYATAMECKNFILGDLKNDGILKRILLGKI